MLFRLLKLYARLAIKVYCRKIVVNQPRYLHARGPLLFAANHPNSFLDGMILTTLMEQPLYSLARGDAFRNNRVQKLLRWLRLLPVYRTSEGTENLAHNYTTFAACQEVFARNGIVMIFSEGRCMNEWHLRPLRKGTARLATSTWQKGIDLTVVPVGFNYNTFRNFGKNVFINFGEPISREAVMQHHSDGKLLLAFNERLKEQLEGLVYEIDPADTEGLRAKLGVPLSAGRKLALAVPAGIGWVLHAPLYYPIKWTAQVFFNNDHFDSVVAALTVLAYPLYLAAVVAAAVLVAGWGAGAALLLMPFCAWACVQVKNQLAA